MNVKPYDGSMPVRSRAVSGETVILREAIDQSLATGKPMEITGEFTPEEVKKYAARLRNMGTVRQLSLALKITATGMVVLATPRPADYVPRTRPTVEKPDTEKPTVTRKAPTKATDTEAPSTEGATTATKAPVKRTRKVAPKS